jgi:uncharacterized protein (TIGR03790 family)
MTTFLPRGGPRHALGLLLIATTLVACGGGGGAGDSGRTTTSVAANTAGILPATSSPGGEGAADLPQPPVLPRSSLAAADLAVLYAEGDATSEGIARAYQQARGIPQANLVPVAVRAGTDVISESDFALLKADLDARLGRDIQATLVTWSQPSRVVGARCAMGLTSALAFGYDAAMCGGCLRTQVSAYFDTDTTRPYTDLQIRPSMMLGAATLADAQVLIARGLAADGAAPTGTGWGVRTADVARSVRYPDFLSLDANWSDASGLAFRYGDSSAAGNPQELVNQSDLMFYFTGLARVAHAASNRFLPGAVADHVTSFGGYLPDGKGQMPATAWLAAGATASYGTVEEPCNHVGKFPQASVLIDHYLRGATVLEAYWKSVAMPGQGLFVGDPLARPWASVPRAGIEGGELVVRSRSLRRNGVYRVEWQDAGTTDWRSLAETTGGQPQPLTWRVQLPANPRGGRLRWVGPCALQPSQSCVLATG